MKTLSDTTLIVLAGGKSLRMGGQNKAFQDLAGKPLIAHSIERFTQQVSHIIISANQDHEQFKSYSPHVVSDLHSGYQGPLAGILAAGLASKTPFIATIPCDAPLLPKNLIERLRKAMTPTRLMAIAHDGEREQSLCMVFERTLLKDLNEFLAQQGRAVHRWQAKHQPTFVDFSTQHNLFSNVNDPQQLAQINQQLSHHE